MFFFLTVRHLCVFLVFIAAFRLSLAVEGGNCSLVALHGFLSVVASFGAEHRLWGPWASAVAVHRLSCPSAWSLPVPGIESISPALAGSFLTTEPLGKSRAILILNSFFLALLSAPHSLFPYLILLFFINLITLKNYFLYLFICFFL